MYKSISALPLGDVPTSPYTNSTRTSPLEVYLRETPLTSLLYMAKILPPKGFSLYKETASERLILRYVAQVLAEPRPVSAEAEEQFDCWLLSPNFYHNNLAPFVGTTVLNLVCTCAVIVYPDQMPAALWITEPILWPIPAKLQNLKGLHREIHVEDPSDKVVIMAMMEGLWIGPLFDSLSKNVPETLSALQNKDDKYITAEELAKAKRRRRGKDDPKRKESRSEYKDEARNKRPNRDSKQTNETCPHTPLCRPELILPPLNAPIA
ncbi:hypothetical protein Acr_00g0033780 [Actinidia rufa]|uniref:Uncharacterized protein n=1 Tax=Actinidia rufa TaxID=165716 RepID=A0A7J0DGA6_9ERIC|nr:hypothetical protein Acr_00g0033780 [Actinidia rufa]